LARCFLLGKIFCLGTVFLSWIDFMLVCIFNKVNLDSKHCLELIS
jgi:hypothetical protein